MGAGGVVSLTLLAQHITDLNTAVNTLETGLPVLGGSHIIAADAPASVLTAAAILETLGYPVWVCDGVNDDIEIQAAIDALAASGGSIILSAGTFEIAAPISLNGVSQNKGINFRGQGQAATLLRLVNGVNGNMFERSDGVTAFFNVWRDMHLMGNQDNNINSSGIYLPLSADNEFINMFIEKFAEQNVYIGQAWDEKFRGCIIEYGGKYGININAGADVKIENSKIIVNNQVGLRFNCRSSTIIGCYIYSNGWDGLQLVAPLAEDNIISGNVFERNGAAAADTYDDIFMSYWRNIIIGNTFRGSAITRYAVRATGSGHQSVIMGNMAQGHTNATPYNVNLYGTDLSENPQVDILMDVLAATADQIVNAYAINVAPPFNVAIAGQPDVPRNITFIITDGDASISAFTMTVTGLDAKGIAQVESFNFAGGLAQVGSIAFATIIQVRFTAITGAGAGDVISVGIGSKLGIVNPIYAAAQIYKVKKNNADYPAASYTLDQANATVDVSPGGAIVGGDDFAIYYKISLNIRQA